MTERNEFFKGLKQALAHSRKTDIQGVERVCDSIGLAERIEVVLKEAQERRFDLCEELVESALSVGWVVKQIEKPSEVGDYVTGLTQGNNIDRVVCTGHSVLDDTRLKTSLYAVGIDLIDTVPVKLSDGSKREKLRQEILSAGIGVTGVDYALAETGSVVIVARPEAARLVSLLPPVHVAVVRIDQILPGLDELFTLRRMDLLKNPGRDYMNIISGPSRSADIESTIVTGVHGPAEVHMVLVSNY